MKGTGTSFTTWVKSLFSPRGKALYLYRRGMAKAKKHDYQGAIADYSNAMRDPHFPADVKAMAIYNRALAYSAIHEDAKAIDDLDAVLAMPGLPQNIRTLAQETVGTHPPAGRKGNGSSVTTKTRISMKPHFSFQIFQLPVGTDGEFPTRYGLSDPVVCNGYAGALVEYDGKEVRILPLPDERAMV